MAKAPRTKFEQTIPDYRRRILVALAKAILVPPLVTVLAFRALGSPFSAFAVLATVLSIPLTVVLRSRYSTWVEHSAAARLGAKPVPRVTGKLPGNFDVVKRVLKGFERGYVLQVHRDLFQEYDCTTLNLRFFWSDQIITMDEGVFQFACSSGFSHFEKGIMWHERIDKLLGTGLFNTDGEEWKKGRTMARPFFSKDRISDFELFERVSAPALDLIAARAERSQPIDAQDLLSRLTLDVGSKFLFGTELDLLSRPLNEPGRVKLGPKGSIPIEGHSELDPFTEAFETVAVRITRRGAQGPTWPLKELLSDATDDPIDQILEWIDPLVRRALERKEANRKAGITSTADEGVFLDFLASSTDDVEHIRYELITYLIAARDTTASLLTFVLYFFALHPEVCSRVREEVLNTFGTDGQPTPEKLKGMKYLRAVLNETLRLFPSAPLVTRMSKDAPLVLPASKEPLYLPPRTQVMMISLLLHRRHDLWGDSADEFMPDRWFDEQLIEKINKTPFMYCPFSGGPRICIGQEFAMNESMYFAIRLMQRFRAFCLAPEFQPAGSLPPAEWKGGSGRQGVEKIWPATSLTMFSKGGLWIYAEPSA
ncbi:cytochrome P450 monooxygenase CYP63 [Obba rivulosa]|uniref:Cytochrome P450 monooxygenase CYP63 n=1 Tax=Obba rivulosa TaxID=1052685 RepID=A0A8E2DI92_9APHY|nr:cytochrome P450 monooxygenase CYP63 [Obba rivulosa]